MRALTLLLSLWFVASHAKASCAAPRPDVIWTYPADGARDVPINALFWVLSTLGGSPAASLNGTPLTVGERGELQPGALLPNHDYTLSLQYPRRDEWDLDVPIKITFRTGMAKARTPSQLAAPQVTVKKQRIPDRLQRVLNAHGCYDTMQNTLVSFHSAGPSLVAYLVGSQLWPAEYGPPSLYLRGPDIGRVCVDLIPISKGGRPGRATRVCTGQRQHATSAPRPD